MVGCVFLSQNWAPLVKKIHKWLAAFFCPKIGHHSLKKFTNGWLRFFCPKIGQHLLKKDFSHFFWPRFWLFVKKIHKCLAAFFCPKIGHHSLKKDFFFTFFLAKKKIIVYTWIGKLPNQKFLILFDTRNQQPIFSNKSVINSPAQNSQMVGCVFFVPKLGTTVTLKKFTNGWLRFFVPKLGTTR